MKILGYQELAKNNVYEDWIRERSYKFRPITEDNPGTIVTQAFMLCWECKTSIKSTGGPGFKCYCLRCYDQLKIQDFAQGHEHLIET